MTEEKKIVCSFCAKTSEQVKKIVAGPGVYICDECIGLCGEIIVTELGVEEEVVNTAFLPNGQEISPKRIFSILSDYAIGQHSAKKALSVSIFNHLKRMEANAKIDDEIEVKKENILMVGPTGTGKTLLARVISKILNVPFVIGDATSLTEAGYVGDDVETLLLKLYNEADGDLERAQRGIVFIDEFDKTSRKSENPSITRDVSGEGVQSALLKMIEGSVMRVNTTGGRKHPHGDVMEFDTSNVLFILGGAFEGIEGIIKSRLSAKKIGFGNETKKVELDPNKIYELVTPEDLKKYGIMPEILGRTPYIVKLNKLTEEDLVSILTEPKDSIVKQYKKMFNGKGKELDFEESALKLIAKEAIENKTGARGLQTILRNKFEELEFELEDIKEEKIIITEEFIKTGSLDDLKKLELQKETV